MNTSKLLVALIAGLALPLAASAAGRYDSPSYDQRSSTSGSQSSDTQVTPSDAPTTAGQPGMADQPNPTTNQIDQPSRTGVEGSPGLPMFDTLDANSDGYIDKNESARSATVKREFKSMDANRDDTISREEWKQGGGQ